MSVDTRTPRPSTGGGTPGFDEPVMTMARVPSDPAQVIVTHASFRVQLGRTSTRSLRLGDTSRIAAAPQHAGAGAQGRRKLAPVVWSGRTEPDDPLAGQLLQAVRRAGDGDGSAGAATQVLPRIDDTTVLPPAVPTVVGPRSGQEPTGLLSGVRPARGAYDEDDEPLVGYRGDPYPEEDAPGDAEPERRPRKGNGDFVKHAWYPHRRMNLGIVLLPLRIFLGFVSIYAGMGKLCDRVYFDGGERGSMVTWLASLHPWAAAEPLRDAALNHPVGAGLSIAFLQVVVGVLTVCGLWQRVAASVGAALSIALLVTVSWRTVPVYDAPDFIYLAAWSPLVIAGAPVYSIDGKLAADAWRRLGPRVGLWDLRRYVLRRGVVLGTVIVGCTLLLGSVLGAAVRATTAPAQRPAGPTAPPVNNLPGVPLPEVSGDDAGPESTAPAPSASAKAKKKKGPDASATAQAPTTAPGRTRTPGSTATTGSGGSSGSSGGSGGSGGHSTPSQPPAAPPPTHAAPPPPPPPADKPTQGAIGGLLGAPLLGAPSPQPPTA
ncbi:DoxX family protein [Actinacidiphila bryophytorum]|nr:DoxX family protein [Actinacidiphila bryophytorum]MBM9438904.1 DoxX family protein [Actinacidiphila bryophytorum]